MKRILFFGLLLLAACSQAPTPTGNADLAAQQLGTRADDALVSVAVDTKLGAVFVMGSTEGSLDGTNKGYNDVILRRYNRNGGVVWKRQLGSSGYDGAGAVATDGRGFVYAGYTLDAPDGTASKLEKLRSDGTSVWNRAIQTRTPYGNQTVEVSALATDKDGNIYAGGAFYETMYLLKYSSKGSLLWTRSAQGGGIFFYPSGISTDASGNVYVTANDIDDSYIANTVLKYSSSGKQLFSKTISSKTNDLELTGLQVQGDALYLVGTKHYNWAGDYGKKYDNDGVVAKYSLSGAKVWQKGFGTTMYDDANGVSVDSDGGVYVTGYTNGTLGGRQVGGSDIFLRKFGTEGNALWTKQIGSKGDDRGYAVAAYSSSELYLVGSAGGALKGGTYRGGQDGFLRRTDGAGNMVWTDQ